MDVVIDTDAYNEIDDQYAISYLVKKSDKLKLQALYAAPFSTTNPPVQRMAWKKAIRKF